MYRYRFGMLVFVLWSMVTFGHAAEQVDSLHVSLPGICFQGTCFEIEVADTLEDRRQGLMLRETLPETSGMLFVFDQPGRYPFWMKNMSIPLDIIWLDGDLQVVYVAENVPPCDKSVCPTYGSNALALYVLELAAGVVQKHQIPVGAKASLQFQ